MSKWTDVSALRLQLADALKRVTAWKLGLGAMQFELGAPHGGSAAELRARHDDLLRHLWQLRNELDVLIAVLDGDDRPTPVHPYAPICDACDTCALRRARLSQPA
jgi:hypothetical protein